MLSLENVISQFAMYASLDIPDAEHYSSICQSGIDTIISSLRPNVDVDFHLIRLENAAAITAFYRYILLQSAENCHNVKVGEIQLSPSSNLGLSAVMTMKDEMLASLSDLIRYDGVFFRQV